MFESKKKKKERKEGKERKKPPKHRFKSICVFDEFDLWRKREFIVITSKLGNVLVTRQINFIYWGRI